MNIKAIQTKQQKMIKKIQFKNRKTKNKGYNTIKKYNIAFNNFNKYIKEYNIQEITQSNINNILEQYQQEYLAEYLTKDHKELSNNTINQYMIIIRKLFTKGCKMELEKLEMLAVEKHDPKYINIQQYQAIQEYLETQTKKCNTKHQEKMMQTDATIINLLFNTGLRIHEALKITIDEITKIEKDHNNNYQLQVIGKGNKKKTIIITAPVYDAIMQYIKLFSKCEQKYVFESDKNKHQPMATRTIERHFNKIASAIDEQENNDTNDANSYTNLLKPHNLRHSYAVHSLEKGIPINAVQKQLRHSSITTTQIYTELNSDGLSDAIANASLSQ